jgi:pimeloyl-ACP methyl ester carboxylesterase
VYASVQLSAGVLSRAFLGVTRNATQPVRENLGTSMRDQCKRPLWAVVAVFACCPALPAQKFQDLRTPTPLPAGSTLVIGFLGGYERWNDEHRSVRRLVLRLRQSPGVYAESIENHRRGLALKLVERALDTNGDGRLDANEKAGARVILFGQSWGGNATVATATDLERLGVPVLLTVQVDSVGLHDAVIPANVHAAVNFYQHDPGAIRGRSSIRAADPRHTAILGNFESSYVFRSVDESDASWARRTFGGSHAKLELDPAVWARVEQYISDAMTRR